MSEQFTEADCLRLINSGETDAYDLLTENLPGVKRRFMALDKALITLLADIKKTFPDAQYYTASGGFHPNAW